MTSTDNLRALIRDIPDFPKPGIMFRDIVPLLGDGEALNQTAQLIADRAIANKASAIVGIDARGFLFGCAAAAIAKIPFVPLRKPGKLPGETISAEYVSGVRHELGVRVPSSAVVHPVACGCVSSTTANG